MVGPSTELLEILTNTAGENLRSIALYGPETYSFVYQRDDVRDLYLPDDIDAIHEALVEEGLGAEYLEGLFNAGELQCSTHVFERVTTMHLVAGPRRGLFVSFDTDDAVPILDVSARCKAWLYDQEFDDLLADA